MLHTGAALSYYKLGKTLLQIGAAQLLQIGASAIANWGSYCKLGQLLLQQGTSRYDKLGQLLQIEVQQSHNL